MMWHDGRFARHSRFRYWLLDTSLRLMTPGMQRTFFKTREAACQYTLKDLEDKQIRRNLVQQMSTATTQLPGSIGERRNMRQQLEAMVHQIEAETADLGENAGAGRIPAGFCTLTCPVYKWRQRMIRCLSRTHREAPAIQRRESTTSSGIRSPQAPRRKWP